MERVATCVCGHLTAVCGGAPRRVSLCHCRACQRRSGGPFGIAAFFGAAAVRIGGEACRYTRRSDAGHEVRFHFCGNCGSTVYWEAERLPGLIAIAVGAFGDPGFPAPEQEVHEGTRHAWVRPLAGPDGSE